jgi:hypothetical protein
MAKKICLNDLSTGLKTIVVLCAIYTFIVIAYIVLYLLLFTAYMIVG